MTRRECRTVLPAEARARPEYWRDRPGPLVLEGCQRTEPRRPRLCRWTFQPGSLCQIHSVAGEAFAYRHTRDVVPANAAPTASPPPPPRARVQVPTLAEIHCSVAVMQADESGL